jgi:DNA-binding NtrC family response regulator
MSVTFPHGEIAEPLVVPPLASYHGAVSEFKRRLIEATLHQVRGNRTHAARALGLQRTYLLRLIRELGVVAPPPPPRRRATGDSAAS